MTYNLTFADRGKSQLKWLVFAALLVLIAMEPVLAGSSSSTSNPFESFIQMLTGWLKGGLGLMLSLLGLAIGLIAGLGRGSLVGALSGVGIAIAAYWGPDILAGIFGATLQAHHYITVASF